MVGEVTNYIYPWEQPSRIININTTHNYIILRRRLALFTVLALILITFRCVHAGVHYCQRARCATKPKAKLGLPTSSAVCCVLLLRFCQIAESMERGVGDSNETLGQPFPASAPLIGTMR